MHVRGMFDYKHTEDLFSIFTKDVHIKHNIL